MFLYNSTLGPQSTREYRSNQDKGEVHDLKPMLAASSQVQLQAASSSIE